MDQIILSNLSYSYSEGPLLSNISGTISSGWTGICGANGAGKTTLMKILAGDIQPASGTATGAKEAYFVPQDANIRPKNLDDFFLYPDSRSQKLLGILGLDGLDPENWDPLSYGEKRKIHMAVAVWSNPEILLADEPTNHIDRKSADKIINAMRRFDGIGVVVSHDRAILNGLCTQCVFLDQSGAVFRPGPYEQGKTEEERERQQAANQKEIILKEEKKLRRLMSVHREEASRSHQKRSKRGLALRDHDSRFKLNRARITGKDGTDGKLLNQLRGRHEQTVQKLENIQVTGQRKYKFNMEGMASKSDRLIFLESGNISLGPYKSLSFPDLELSGITKIALTGVNGSGKTSLIRELLKNARTENFTYLPQELGTEQREGILKRVESLSSDRRGAVYASVYGLGSEPRRIISGSSPSPGELRKLFFALEQEKQPALFIMDEPTNHMDLPSIELLEKALSSIEAGMLLVSHDREFLDKICDKEWKIEEGEFGDNILNIL